MSDAVAPDPDGVEPVVMIGPVAPVTNIAVTNIPKTDLKGDITEAMKRASMVFTVNVTEIETFRKLAKRMRRLVEQLNRIRNLTPGRRRIWELDEIAMVLEMDADAFEVGEDGPANMELAADYRAKALYLRRLEWDLSELRDAVRGEHRRMSRTDPRHWKGDRP